MLWFGIRLRQLGSRCRQANATVLSPWPAMIDKLEFVIALAREKHFGRAAEACGVSQPTLSAGLKQLEDTLGVLLVQRGSRFRSFTPEGERVLKWARRIVGDARGLRQEIDALKRGLVGHIRIAAIPTALAMVATLTTPFHARHPNVRFTVLARTSHEMLQLIENLELDAGLTYVDNEPLGHVTAIPLYREQYHLVTSSDSVLGDRKQVTWEDVARIPLCLLTPDTQTRRILDHRLQEAGAGSSPMLESDSMVVLYAHVRTGRWSTIMPGTLVEALGLMDCVHSIPIVDANARQTIGLIVPNHDPAPPITVALVAQARQLAKTLLPSADGPTS
jgi:DNA-binding transcriptional LysR family regulator